MLNRIELDVRLFTILMDYLQNFNIFQIDFGDFRVTNETVRNIHEMLIPHVIEVLYFWYNSDLTTSQLITMLANVQVKTVFISYMPFVNIHIMTNAYPEITFIKNAKNFE